MAWIFSPLGGTNCTTSHHLLWYSSAQCPKRNYKISSCGPFEAEHPKRHQNPFFIIPKRYNEQPLHFYMGSPHPTGHKPRFETQSICLAIRISVKKQETLYLYTIVAKQLFRVAFTKKLIHTIMYSGNIALTHTSCTKLYNCTIYRRGVFKNTCQALKLTYNYNKKNFMATLGAGYGNYSIGPLYL